MPIHCPICNSENVVVVCRVLVNYTIEGELCGEQDWIRGEVDDDSAKPQYAECKHCKAILGVVMVGESLAALTQKSVPGTVTHPLTGHQRSVSAGDLEPEALCQNCGGVGCHACLTEVRDAELEPNPPALALAEVVAELERATSTPEPGGEPCYNAGALDSYSHALALLRRVVPGEDTEPTAEGDLERRAREYVMRALDGEASDTALLDALEAAGDAQHPAHYQYRHWGLTLQALYPTPPESYPLVQVHSAAHCKGIAEGMTLRDALRQLLGATAGEKESGPTDEA